MTLFTGALPVLGDEFGAQRGVEDRLAAGTTPIDLGTLAAGATKTIYISTQVQPQAGNEVQSDSASFMVKADLNQS